MRLSLEPETVEQEISSLRLELSHVNEQCRIAHAIAQAWKHRALKAEAQIQRQHKGRGNKTLTQKELDDDTLLIA
jgi:hypothetical protein